MVFSSISSVGATHSAPDKMSLLWSFESFIQSLPPAHTGGYKYGAPTEQNPLRPTSRFIGVKRRKSILACRTDFPVCRRTFSPSLRYTGWKARGQAESLFYTVPNRRGPPPGLLAQSGAKAFSKRLLLDDGIKKLRVRTRTNSSLEIGILFHLFPDSILPL
jgi:hypothetical protein